MPSFDLDTVRFRADLNPAVLRVYRDGQPEEMHLSELIADQVPSIILELGAAIAGFRILLLVPIVIDDRVVGSVVFSQGGRFGTSQRALAEDYQRQVTLQWENMLLTQRLQSIEGDSRAPLGYGSLYLDPTRREAYLGEWPLPLTALEYALLSCFVEHAERPLSRDELARRVWR